MRFLILRPFPKVGKYRLEDLKFSLKVDGTVIFLEALLCNLGSRPVALIMHKIKRVPMLPNYFLSLAYVSHSTHSKVDMMVVTLVSAPSSVSLSVTGESECQSAFVIKTHQKKATGFSKELFISMEIDSKKLKRNVALILLFTTLGSLIC